MEKNDSSQIIQGYIDAAAQKLDSAKILLEHKKYDDAVSRAYYSAFHCAQALLISIGLKAESHSGVRQLFGLHFIKSGKIDKKFARNLKSLQDDREDGDYGIFSIIDEDDAKDAVLEAEEFLNETKRILQVNNLKK